MAKRTVDVFLGDKRAYVFCLESSNRSATDYEFIELAKEVMCKNACSDKTVADAHFVVSPA